MYQRTITAREAGQRFDKYLHKLLPEAGNAFLYKMLRKKNIVLNQKKAEGSEKIACGDVVSIYFSEETLQKFMGSHNGKPSNQAADRQDSPGSIPYEGQISVLYENDHILIADKPAGILTQKAAAEDISLNEWLICYLLSRRQITEAELLTFKPSACNRLDRNTSGIVLCGKTIKGAQMLSGLLKKRSLHKFYKLYVKGSVTEEKVIEGYLHKDKKHNKASINEGLPSKKNQFQITEETSYIKTRYIPIRQERDKTLLEAELITGKPHQIRAHLASIGHPLLGDGKYGDRQWNEQYRKSHHVTHQLLHAYKIVFPYLEEPFSDISGKTIYAPMPDIFAYVADKESL